MGSRTLWLWIFVGLLAVTALLGVVAILMPHIPNEEEMLSSSALLTGFSLLGLMASVAIAREKQARLAWVSIGLLVVSLLGWLFLIWFHGAIGNHVGDVLAKSAGTGSIFGILALHAAMLCQLRFIRRLSISVRIGAISTACLAGLIVTATFWNTVVFSYDWDERLIGAFSILAALGTLAVPILARIEFVARRDGHEHTIGQHVSVSIRCPRCGHEDTLSANHRVHCSECGLEITISIAEPRCVCGYLLYGLPEPVCPECGRALEEETLWWQDRLTHSPPPMH